MDAVLRKQIKDEVQACQKCALFMGCGGPVTFYGPTPSSIALVGEAPGKYEDVQRRPFVGPAGQLARRWLEKVLIDPESVAWLNVVSCYPSRTPTGNEVEACRGNLYRQLSVIRPDFVLVVGGIAASVWNPLLRIGDLRGRWWDLPGSIPGGSNQNNLAQPTADAEMASEGNWQGALALATWHPAAVLRNRSLYKQALEDVTYFAMVAKDETGCVFSDRCVMCGALYDKVDDNGIAWCFKHWAQKHGDAGYGRGKPKFKKRKNVKDRRLIEIVED